MAPNTNGTPRVTIASLQKRIAELEAKSTGGKRDLRNEPVSLKIGEKGGIVVSGLGSWRPTTLYASQMEKLLDHEKAIREFIKVNTDKLARKTDTPAA